MIYYLPLCSLFFLYCYPQQGERSRMYDSGWVLQMSPAKPHTWVGGRPEIEVRKEKQRWVSRPEHMFPAFRMIKDWGVLRRNPLTYTCINPPPQSRKMEGGLSINLAHSTYAICMSKAAAVGNYTTVKYCRIDELQPGMDGWIKQTHTYMRAEMGMGLVWCLGVILKFLFLGVKTILMVEGPKNFWSVLYFLQNVSEFFCPFNNFDAPIRNFHRVISHCKPFKILLMSGQFKIHDGGTVLPAETATQSLAVYPSKFDRKTQFGNWEKRPIKRDFRLTEGRLSGEHCTSPLCPSLQGSKLGHTNNRGW